MIVLLSASQMRKIEKDYMTRSGVSETELVKRAASAMADVICHEIGGAAGKAAVFACGKGGNGSDGYETARLFALRGGRSFIVELFPEGPFSPACSEMRYNALNTPNVYIAKDIEMPKPSAWIDAMFGIGFSGNLPPKAREIAARMEQDRSNGCPVFSCDIPSGLDTDTGKAAEGCVKADCTVTFQYAKRGHFLNDGLDVCGSVSIMSIGIDAKPQGMLLKKYDEADLKNVIPVRRRNTHKGDYGHLLIVAGSFGMAGAAALCAGAALRSGAGLVTIACAASIVPILQTLVPCAMCVPLPEKDGAIADEALPAVLDALNGKSAAAVGPGLSRRCSPAIVQAVLGAGIPAVIDADALNIISQEHTLKELLCERHVITPHPGEASRLGAAGDDPLENAIKLSPNGACVIYKGASSVIYGQGTAVLSTAGTAGMARGGSGDVLTGICGALLSRGITPFEAACAACELHGIAGEAAEGKNGIESMTASDIVDSLKEAFRHVR